MSTKTSPQYKLPPHTLKLLEALHEEVLEQALFELNDMINSPSSFSEEEYLEIVDLRGTCQTWEEFAQKLLIDRLKSFDCLRDEHTLEEIEAMTHPGKEDNPFRYAFDEHPIISEAAWLAWQLIDWRAVGVKAQETYARFEQVYQNSFE